MQNCLYMICPSDNIEPVIYNRFSGHKYFYTSLGNAVVFDSDTARQLSTLIEDKSISQIVFILSEDNQIVLDAFDKQKFIDVQGLKKAYHRLEEHQEQTHSSWKLYNEHEMILSYHLNEKIEELNILLHKCLDQVPCIKGMIYSKSYHAFKEIHSELVCVHSSILN